MVCKGLQHLFQVFDMRIHTGAVNQNIVKEDEDKFPQERLEYLIHQRLKSSRGVGQPKGHYEELVMALGGTESCFMDILRTDPMVS